MNSDKKNQENKESKNSIYQVKIIKTDLTYH